MKKTERVGSTDPIHTNCRVGVARGPTVRGGMGWSVLTISFGLHLRSASKLSAKTGALRILRARKK